MMLSRWSLPNGTLASNLNILLIIMTNLVITKACKNKTLSSEHMIPCHPINMEKAVPTTQISNIKTILMDMTRLIPPYQIRFQIIDNRK